MRQMDRSDWSTGPILLQMEDSADGSAGGTMVWQMEGSDWSLGQLADLILQQMEASDWSAGESIVGKMNGSDWSVGGPIADQMEG